MQDASNENLNAGNVEPLRQEPEAPFQNATSRDWQKAFNPKRELGAFCSGVTQRIPWVDNAKALGIIAVFYGHIVSKLFTTYAIPTAGLQYKLIYSFHMPLFFLLSGFLVKETQHRKLVMFMKNKFMTRIVPFFFFNILVLPCYFIYAKISNRSIDVSPLFQASFYLNLLAGMRS